MTHGKHTHTHTHFYIYRYIVQLIAFFYIRFPVPQLYYEGCDSPYIMYIWNETWGSLIIGKKNNIG